MTALHARQKHDAEDFQLFPGADVQANMTSTSSHEDEGWFEGHVDGRLSVDVLETETELVVRSPIAGVKPENLEIFVQNDMLTIRGKRHVDSTSGHGTNYLVRECHWGSFSRSVILPVEVDADAIAATLKDGVLVVTMPKARHAKRISVQRT